MSLFKSFCACAFMPLMLCGASAFGENVMLETEYAVYGIAPNGQNARFADKRTGKDYLESKPATWFLTLKKGPKAFYPASCSMSDGKITARFKETDAAVVVKVVPKPHYFVFEVVSVSDPGMEEVRLGNVRLSLSKYVDGTLCEVSDDEFAGCMLALNLQMYPTLAGGPMLTGLCYQRFGFAGAKAALIGCPREKLRDVLKEIVKGEGLPESPVGGPWACEAEEPRGSYLFGTPSEANIDDWIALARRGGLTQIMFSGWARFGDYQPHPALYPNGIEGLKQVVQKVHAAGLQALMHTHSGGIDRGGPWVTPVPDKRLAKEATFTLADSVTPDAKFIPTTEPPQGVSAIASYASRGMDIQIGDEIITYGAFSLEPPYGFKDCRRGTCKTKPASHQKGAQVAYLAMRYGFYLPDLDSSLAEEQADCIAKIINECECDGLYFDGLEANGALGPYWHYCGKMLWLWCSKFKRRMHVEGSCFPHHMWLLRSETGAMDTFHWAVKRGLDEHIRYNVQSRAANFLPAQVGWWGINGAHDCFDSTVPDEIEYLCAKCIGNDMSFSLQGVRPTAKPTNGRQDELLTIMGRYERLRLANYFSEAVKERLRTPGDDFHLVQGEDGEWQFLPTDYLAHRVTGLNDGTSKWEFGNRYGAQPVKLRIHALMSAEPYDSPGAMTLCDFKSLDEFKERAGASGVKCDLASSSEQARPGAVSGLYTAESKAPDPRAAWSRARKVFAPTVDFRKYGALGLWVYGDGKGELLNVQLENQRGIAFDNFDDHYIDVDFKGWRYFELHIPERDAERYQDYKWPYRGVYAIYRFGDWRSCLNNLNLYYSNLPAGDKVACHISPVKALPVKRVKLKNPSVTIGGKTVTFPVELESRCYIEFNSMSDCKLYDERGALLQEITPQGEAPSLAPGKNDASFACEGPQGYAARARVVVISSGDPIRGMGPKDKINWNMLRTEYELPREIQALDGKQNAWGIICRRDAQARLEAEIAVDAIGGKSEAYESANAITLEDFEDLSGFADSPDNQYLRYVWAGEHKGVAALPGVTQTLECSAESAKVGKSCTRYSAVNSTAESGWCARGKRFTPPLILSNCSTVGFWINGDAAGEFLKLQLRDTAGAYYDMVTRVDFSGWRFVEFPLSDAKIDLSKVEYAILFFNGIPAGKTVRCGVDGIKAYRDARTLENPALSIGGQKIVFPVAVSAGDRLVYDGDGDCKLLGANKAVTVVKPNGPSPRLKPGRNSVIFDAGENAPKELKIRISLCKIYP